MADDIKIDGMEQVERMLKGVTDPVKIAAALGKCCALVERSAKQKAPKDSGDLRRSITSRVEGEVGIVFTPLEYAPYQEFGTGIFAETGGRQSVWAYEDEETGELIWTHGNKPHPFLRPALNENRAQIKRILKEGITSK